MRGFITALILLAAPVLFAGQGRVGPLKTQSGAILVESRGKPVTLLKNPRAVRPTLAQVIALVSREKIDRLPYLESHFVCTEFAVLLHDRAHVSGIECFLVGLDFPKGPGHSLNAFNTTDQGLVFVDVTGSRGDDGASGYFATFGYVRKGAPYGRLHLSLGAKNPKDYDFYQAICRTQRKLSSLGPSLTMEGNQIIKLGEELDAIRSQITTQEEAEAFNARLEEIEAKRMHYNERATLFQQLSEVVKISYNTSLDPVTSIDIW